MGRFSDAETPRKIWPPLELAKATMSRRIRALTALRARAFVEDLVRGVALEASGFDRITRRRREGAHAVELIAGQEGLEGGERHLR